MCRTPGAIRFIPCNCIFFDSYPEYCEASKQAHRCWDGSHPSIVIRGHQPRLEKCGDPKNPSLRLRYEYFGIDDGVLYERYEGYRIIYERNEDEYPWWGCQKENKLEEVQVAVGKGCPFHEWVREDELREVEEMKREEVRKKKEAYERSLFGKCKGKFKRGLEVAGTFQSGWSR